MRRTAVARRLAGLKERLLAPDAVEYVRKAVVKAVRGQAKASKPNNNAARRRELEGEITNLTDAIASGALKSSPAIAKRLSQAEAALERLRDAPAPPAVRRVERMLPRVVEEHRAFVDELAERLADVDVHRARAALRRMYGTVRAVAKGDEVHLEIENGGLEAAVLQAAGATGANLVAGAGFEPATFGL